MNSPRYLRRKAAAEYVRQTWGAPCTPGWLAKLAVVGGGPIFRHAAKIPLYTTDWLDQWIESRLGKPMRSTSDIREDA